MVDKGQPGKSHLIKKLLDGIWGSNTIVLTMRCVVVFSGKKEGKGVLVVNHCWMENDRDLLAPA